MIFSLGLNGESERRQPGIEPGGTTVGLQQRRCQPPFIASALRNLRPMPCEYRRDVGMGLDPLQRFVKARPVLREMLARA
jgi:hypothetical protein